MCKNKGEKDYLPKFIKEFYGNNIDDLSNEKIAFYIKAEQKNLEQLDLSIKDAQKARRRKKKQIETLKEILEERRKSGGRR